MLEISDRELRKFREENEKILKEFKSTIDTNLARNWYRFKGSFQQAKNYLVITICKFLPPSGLKNHLYRLIGVDVGESVSIANGVIIDTIFPELIKIEDNAIIGWGSKLFAHEFDLESFRIGSIRVGKNSMIGEFSVVRPGVDIGKNSQVAAMSFVNEDVEEETLEGGVPIHMIKHYEDIR